MGWRDLKSRGLALNTIGRPSGSEGGKRGSLESLNGGESSPEVLLSLRARVPGSPTATELVSKSPGSSLGLEDRGGGLGRVLLGGQVRGNEHQGGYRWLCRPLWEENLFC